MKFAANRKVLLEYLKSMQKAVPKTSINDALKGFLIEACEDDGYLYLTANNLEVAVQRKFKPSVESGGRFVMDARLIIDILSRLGGSDVTMEMEKAGTIKIKSDNCTYTMQVLDGEKYLKPDIPFPDTTLFISGVKTAYDKTSFVCAKDGVSESLKGIRIEVKPHLMRAICCNKQNIAMTTKDVPSNGEMSFTIPKESFSCLASAAGNDELEVGFCGNNVVFLKEGLLFSARVIDTEYVKVDDLFNNFEQIYLAKAEYEDLKTQVVNACDIAAMGTETSYVSLKFSEDKIMLTTQNDVGKGTNFANVVMIKGSVGHEFYYPANQLKEIFKTVEGTLAISLDKRGYMLVFDRCNKFMLTPVRKDAVEKQFNKFIEIKNKPAKTAKGKKTSEKLAA